MTINNDYVYELIDNFDTTYLKEIIHKMKTNYALLPHQNLVDHDSYLSSIRKKYPFLSSLFNVYQTAPGRSIPLHIDSKRNCALNIPIMNTECSYTIFYKFKEDTDIELKHVPERVYDLIESPVEETFKFTLNKPSLVNNSVPHKMLNFGDKTRIIISWSVQEQYSFEDIKHQLINTSLE
jgi:hypothetical protein